MYEELIQGLRDKAEFLRKANRDSSIHNSFAETMSQAADAIEVISKTEKTTRWIPVTEQPKNPHGLRREYFLVALESGCVESLGYDFDCNRWHITGSPVTHWMPLPEPPKEGE